MKIKGYEVKLVPDLCKMVMQSSSELEEIASSVILACYPRAVRSLFRSHNLEPQKVVDIRNLSIEEICKQLDITSEDVQDTPVKKAFVSEVRTFPVETGTDAWYPVLDKERCCECEKCHDFCLFGVYSIEDGLVRVGDYYKSQGRDLDALRMYWIAPDKKKCEPIFEKLSVLIRSLINKEDQFHE